ncbi:MAG: nicotinate-nucleotide adenylyltransferase [Magnetococcales bacterium]|nr:nicotinate-nucleotide adenylyltransferase [Magnetococcales bacterium]
MGFSVAQSEKIGILGGAFNPPHFGHLRSAREALELLKLDRIIFTPSGEHPLKKSATLASATHRLAMTRQAIASEPLFEVSDLEVKQSGVSYTVDTLEKLAACHKNQELFFIVGGDILGELHRWKDWSHILTNAHLVMMIRPGFPVDLSSTVDPVARFLNSVQINNPEALNRQTAGGYRFAQLPVTPLDISSTQIRELAKQRRSLRFLTPDGVMEYINHNQLYVSE